MASEAIMKLFKKLLLINLILACGVLGHLLHKNAVGGQIEPSQAMCMAELIEEEPQTDKIKLLAKAIEKFEGNYAGSLAYRNNNPGNLRGAPTQAGRRDGFAYFRTYEDGFNALKSHIKNAALGNSRYYDYGITVEEYFNIYAPVSDDNQPNLYFNFLINETGFDRDIKLLDLL